MIANAHSTVSTTKQHSHLQTNSGSWECKIPEGTISLAEEERLRAQLSKFFTAHCVLASVFSGTTPFEALSRIVESTGSAKRLQLVTSCRGKGPCTVAPYTHTKPVKAPAYPRALRDIVHLELCLEVNKALGSASCFIDLSTHSACTISRSALGRVL